MTTSPPPSGRRNYQDRSSNALAQTSNSSTGRNSSASLRTETKTNTAMKEGKRFKDRNRPGIEGSLTSARILCADDQPALRACYSIALTHSGYSVTTVANGQEAWDALQSSDFDLLITDHEMPLVKGAELVSRVRSAGLEQPIIIATSNTEFFTDPSNRWHRVVLLEKPFGLQELTEAVGRLLRAAGAAAVRGGSEPRTAAYEGPGPAAATQTKAIQQPDDDSDQLSI